MYISNICAHLFRVLIIVLVTSTTAIYNFIPTASKDACEKREIVVDSAAAVCSRIGLVIL